MFGFQQNLLVMKKITPRLGLSRLTVLGFIQFIVNILSQMSGNSSFPSPTPTLAAIQDKLDEYKHAVTEAAARIPGARALRNQLRVELSIMITDLANYCVLVAAGDTSVFESSGFSVRRTAQPAPNPLETVVNVLLQSVGVDTELRLLFKAVPYAKSYEVWLSPVDDMHFTYLTTISSQRYVINNLSPGTRYFVKFRAIGPRGIVGGFSAATSKIAA